MNSAQRLEAYQFARRQLHLLETEPQIRSIPYAPHIIKTILREVYATLQHTGASDESPINAWVKEGSRERIQSAVTRQLDLSIAFQETLGRPFDHEDHEAIGYLRAYASQPAPTRNRLILGQPQFC